MDFDLLSESYLRSKIDDSKEIFDRSSAQLVALAKATLTDMKGLYLLDYSSINQSGMECGFIDVCDTTKTTFDCGFLIDVDSIPKAVLSDASAARAAAHEQISAVYSKVMKEHRWYAERFSGANILIFRSDVFEWVENCSTCAATGKIYCSNCNNGTIICYTCNGTGYNSCPGCYGQGTMSTGHTCLVCHGNGRVQCNTCVCGVAKCNICLGDPWFECHRCKGRKIVHRNVVGELYTKSTERIIEKVNFSQDLEHVWKNFCGGSALPPVGTYNAEEFCFFVDGDKSSNVASVISIPLVRQHFEIDGTTLSLAALGIPGSDLTMDWCGGHLDTLAGRLNTEIRSCETKDDFANLCQKVPLIAELASNDKDISTIADSHLVFSQPFLHHLRAELQHTKRRLFFSGLKNKVLSFFK